MVRVDRAQQRTRKQGRPRSPVRIEMLRRVQEQGRLHHVFFVSHNADAAALADAQIQLKSGGSAHIVYPPF